MLDLLPVLLESPFLLELGTVVQVVALQALPFGLVQRQSHGEPQFVDLLGTQLLVVRLGGHVFRSGAVADFTADVVHLGRGFQAQVS